ncbi:MAG TPA: hypothetical protein DIT89_05590 [Planctomycetaceae bacterium]|nr:hypothetical protein [Planctomycetaceae bacterium]
MRREKRSIRHNQRRSALLADEATGWGTAGCCCSVSTVGARSQAKGDKRVDRDDMQTPVNSRVYKKIQTD